MFNRSLVMGDIIPPITIDGFHELANMPSDAPTDETHAEHIALQRFLVGVDKNSIAIIVTNLASGYFQSYQSKYIFNATAAQITDGVTHYGYYGGGFGCKTVSLMRGSTTSAALSYELFYYGTATNDEIAAILAALRPKRAVVPYRYTPRAADAEIIKQSGITGSDWWFYPGTVWLTPYTNSALVEVVDFSKLVFCGSGEHFSKRLNALSWYRKNTRAANTLVGQCQCFDCGMLNVVNITYSLDIPSIHRNDCDGVGYDNADSHIETESEYDDTEECPDWSEVPEDTSVVTSTSTHTSTSTSGTKAAKDAEFAEFKAAIAEHSKVCHEPDKYVKLVGKVLDGGLRKLPITIEDVQNAFGGELIDYKHKHTMYKSQLHSGQVKLLFTEIQFLLTVKSTICVYAGAAESCKGAFLAYMFPHIKFLLVDPRKFEIQPYKDVFVRGAQPGLTDGEIVDEFAALKAGILTYNGYFTNSLATLLKAKFGAGKIAFISDIRTVSTKPASEEEEEKTGPTEADIIVNNAQQTAWVHLLAPEKSMLKFRHPFYDAEKSYMAALEADGFFKDTLAEAKAVTGVDFLENARNGITQMHQGTCYIQPYARVSSCEVRLHIDGTPAIHQQYVAVTHDAIMYTLNNVIRPYYFHHHAGISANHKKNRKFDGCYDCNLAHHIMAEYMKVYPKVFPGMQPRDVIFEMMDLIGKSFHDPNFSHGHKYSNIVGAKYYAEGIATAMDNRKNGNENTTRSARKTSRYHGKHGKGQEEKKTNRHGKKSFADRTGEFAARGRGRGRGTS